MEHSGSPISSVRLPPPLRSSSRVGVAALSGPVAAADLERGLQQLRELGLEPVRAANLLCRRGFLAGGDEERLQAFHDLVAEPSVGAVFFARGGHGVLRLLPRLDWDLLQRRPLAYVGYSDLTPFLLEVVRRLGLATFHGPMVVTDMAGGLTTEESDSLLAALSGELPATLPVVLADSSAEVEGPLLGGCLSLLTATLGTPFAINPAGAVLFWEEIGEPLYRLDRMLIQLRLSGSLDRIAAMVVGKVQPSDAEGLDGLYELLDDAASGSPWAVAHNCPSGHCRPNLTLPIGPRARLRPGQGELLVGLRAED